MTLIALHEPLGARRMSERFMKTVVQLHRLMTTILGVLMLSGCGGDNGQSPLSLPDWFSPECDEVTGFRVATFSTDGGVTFKPNTSAPVINDSSITRGLAAASAHGGLLFAAHSIEAYLSTDAGCSWEPVTSTSDGFFHLVASDRYGYAISRSPGSYDTLYRFDADGSVASYELSFWVLDLATTPADPTAVYALSLDSNIYRSDDLGRTMVLQGIQPPFPDVPERLYINPRDSLHFFATGLDQPGVSFDGGVTWTESTGILGDASTAVTFDAAFGGAGQGEVWVIGGRHYRDDEGNIIRDEDGLFRSLDGGLTFEQVLVDGEGISIGNGKELAVPYGVFGEIVLGHNAGPFGQPARSYRYRASDDTVTVRYYEPEESCGFNRLLFHPTDPDVLYMGRQDDVDCTP